MKKSKRQMAIDAERTVVIRGLLAAVAYLSDDMADDVLPGEQTVGLLPRGESGRAVEVHAERDSHASVILTGDSEYEYRHNVHVMRVTITIELPTIG